MNVQRNLLLLLILAAVASPASGQQAAPASEKANSGSEGAASIPDFSGIWRHGSLPWFVPPASGPGPVTNRSRRKDNGVSNYSELVGDYTNPILQPWAAEVVKKKGDLSLAGVTYPNPANECWPEPVPFLFKHMAMQMLQRPDKIVMLFNEDHEVRYVRMNQAHPAQVTPSWSGDSVGHYEGDTLVIDTVGIKTGPYTMVDQFGTPHTEALHVIERYRLIDYQAAMQALERGAKENANMIGNDSGVVTDLNDKGKHMQLEITVEDPGAFTTPWSATVIYRPGVSAYGASSDFPEAVCAENPHELARQAGVPTAEKSDF